MTSRARPPRRRIQPYDVLFYVPSVGALVSEQPSRVVVGGSETQAFRLARALARGGLHVAMVAYDEHGDLPRDRHGVHFVPRPGCSRAPSPVRRTLEAIRITRVLASAPSCAVVVRVGGAHVGWVVLYARLTRRRTIFASANLSDFDCKKVTSSRINRALYRLGVRLAHEIVVQTQEQFALCQTTFKRTPILIRSIAAPAERQLATPEAFIWVGRLVPYKRPFEYVELARALPDAEFWMVAVPSPTGPARVHDRLLVEADALPNLTVFGPRSSEDIGRLFDHAVACVSTSDFEGMPNVFLEAWSRGVPSLAFRHDPDGVIARHALGGYADGSRENLIALARELWSTRADRAELAVRCRAYIAEHHTLDATLPLWTEVVGRLTQRRAAALNGRHVETGAALQAAPDRVREVSGEMVDLVNWRDRR